jgi:transposase-like protein
MWYVTSQKFGGSALGLKRVLGLGGYQTAWCWLYKLRHAMARPGREPLCGTIEVDETLIGGEEHGGKRGRGAGRKSLVVIAVKILEPKGFGRIRMKHINNASAENLIPFVVDSVKSGSTIHTDCWRGYNQLESLGYKHEKINISESDDFAHVLMPGVHRVASLFKRWLARNPSRSRKRSASGLLFGRIHLSIQPKKIDSSRTAFLSTDAAGRRCTHGYI